MDIIARFIQRPPAQRPPSATAAGLPAGRAHQRPPSAGPGRPGPAMALPPTEDDLPRGCGWFDSSHELQCGLQITEHDSPDRVAQHLPLDTWLAWHLAGGTAAGPPLRA